ncbi:MAG: DNA repair protein RecN [Prevotella sp.]|nr:DNA repair protein RecN [Prevotella sp.]
MLKQLYIKNFTLIDELDITFHSGFSVITGETGAGKSIILGALHLLLGARADSKQIKNGSSKCVVEAHFDLSHYGLETFFDEFGIDYDANDCIIRREVNDNGKSRAFVNDTPVALTTMRELGEQLIDIHSQHQNLLLQKEDFQLNVVDIIADNAQLRQSYLQAYNEYHKATKRFNDFQEASQKSKENEEFLRFQFSELDKAKLVAGEDEELEQQSRTLSHVEDIKSALYDASSALSSEDGGCVEKTKNASSRLHDITEVFPEIKDVDERLSSAYIELKDIAQEIERKLEDVDFDPRQLDEINSRLDLIYALEQKFHASSVDELINEYKRLQDELASIDGGDEQLEQLQQEMQEKFDVAMKLARKLSDARKKAAQKVEEGLKQRLVPLGIPNVKFKIEFKERDCSPSGIDKVSFLFSANSSTALQPVSQVASGGEISRVMLSLKAMISGAVKLPTIIFDEIDTGVSGRVAEKMAQIMKEMGDNHRQVLSITHLPQIAAIGATHYKVSKEETAQGTISHMQMLTEQERIEEIAQMLSGSDISEAAIANAKTLLKNSTSKS